MASYIFSRLFDLLYFFTYNLIALLPCLIGYIRAKWAGGKWGWYKIGVFVKIWTFLGALIQLSRGMDFQHIYLSAGEEITGFILLYVYYLLIKKEIQKREADDNNI